MTTSSESGRGVIVTLFLCYILVQTNKERDWPYNLPALNDYKGLVLVQYFGGRHKSMLNVKVDACILLVFTGFLVLSTGPEED